jgi:three-Cys-motif partner protein
MSWNKKNDQDSSSWGGDWTSKKLNVFIKYVIAYLTIMNKNKFWETIYFDGFAGSGELDSNQNPELKNDLFITKEQEDVYQGSPERVLGLDHPFTFDKYVFVEKSLPRAENLKKILQTKSQISNRNFEIKSTDANNALIEFGSYLKENKSATLIFLDPFGMQIDWTSIEAFENTRSDIWILIPTGVVINRLLDRKGELVYSDKLEKFFGLSIDEIKQIFYSIEEQQGLFGSIDMVTKIKKPIEMITKIYVQKLNSIWKFVTEEPLVLKNSKGSPIFHFVMASNNKNAIKIA